MNSQGHAYHSACNFVSAFLVQLTEMEDITKCQNVDKNNFSMNTFLSFLSYCSCTVSMMSRLKMQYVREAHQLLSVN